MNKMTGPRANTLSGAEGRSCAPSQLRCHIESSACVRLQQIGPVPCIQQSGKKWKGRARPIRTPPSEKPQVPPKPAHLKASGKQILNHRIPPAPSKSLPLAPKPTRRPGIKERGGSETSDISILIKKFESLRQPVQLGRHSRYHFRVKMEQGTSPLCCAHVSTRDSDSGIPLGEQGRPTEEEPSAEMPMDNLKSRDFTINDINNCGGNNASVNRTEQPPQENGNLTVDHNDNGKIPNRDSGIDSPSCSVVGEVFPNDESVEHKKLSLPVHMVEIGIVRKNSDSSSVDQKRDSTQDEDSDLDEGSSEEHESMEVPKAENIDSTKCSEHQRLYNIARELLQTEEAYVKRLDLLDQVFCTRLLSAGIPQDAINGIFSNISSIYRFHCQFLLPELKARIMQEWDTNPRIGDILQKLAPFLKMYGEYVKNFDKAMDLVNSWTQRSSTFKEVVYTIQKDPVCGNLTLQHHMLEPVQRIPRYELLLKDYLKKLPEDSPDRKDSEKSLELISTAANHSNAAIRKMEKMHKLLEVYERLGGEEDIVNPANELIKEGHIQKLSAKNGTTQDRYLYLFNSMLLYCVPKLRLMGQKFSVREKIDIAGIQVQETVKNNSAHMFQIIGKKRSLELQTRTEEEKKEWIQVIQATIEKHKQNSETFRAFNNSFSREDDYCPDSPVAGSGGPCDYSSGMEGCGSPGGADSLRKSSKIKREKEKQNCKGCGESFHSITKRRHHCKQCGAVICAKCSEFKLLAENSRHNRVCKECFPLVSSVPGSPGGSADSGESKRKVEKQNSLSPENCVFSSNLLYLEKGKTWMKVWVSVPRNEPLVMYLQGSGQEGKSPRAIPLPGYDVSLPSAGDKVDLKHVFKLSQSQQTLFFSAEDEDLLQKWRAILSKASRGDTSITAEDPEKL
ncbi:FYVE, RhoGEF and PH domain-containing protein 3 [Xenopus laevis]|uniref:FYVE, RhoGEF and PH domain-containing protein 3 n=1 Tax=Xenopus laevis TaxID=8355 RepID=A0A8J0U6F7_XENLA|nr:FYVE, RhoGEF and PH domain-containing protein 3 [Xenopus laevis]